MKSLNSSSTGTALGKGFFCFCSVLELSSESLELQVEISSLLIEVGFLLLFFFCIGFDGGLFPIMSYGKVRKINKLDNII